MKVLIVDDEPLARLRIRRYLEATRPLWTVDEANDGVDALEKIGATMPELLFLDVEMPELSGFAMLQQLQERPFRLIFQTAYDQFAVRAFEENACDYLLKPFTDDRLETAIRKALATPASDALGRLDAHLAREKRWLTQFVVKAGSRAKIFEEHEVLAFVSEEHVTRIILESIDYAYASSLAFLEERLDPTRFVRTHRNSIVRLGAVRSFDRSAQASVTLKNGMQLPVSRDRKQRLIEAFSPTDQ